MEQIIVKTKAKVEGTDDDLGVYTPRGGFLKEGVQSEFRGEQNMLSLDKKMKKKGRREREREGKKEEMEEECLNE